ncbi:MAG TPA: hypothetical protein VGJ91_08970 [Polyangiaceae bacterium]
MTPKKPAEDQSPQPPVVSPAAPATADVALIHGVTPDGEGFKILRARGDRLELGAIRPLREGVPITGEVVTLRPRANFPALCDVETHFKPPEEASDRQAPPPSAVVQRSGPAQVATDEYRRNWDAIWSQPATKSKLVN